MLNCWCITWRLGFKRLRQNMRNCKEMARDPAQCQDLVLAVFKSKKLLPIKCHLSTDSWLPYFTPWTAKWAVRKWSGRERIFLCSNARASYGNNSLLKTTMSADTETCFTTTCSCSQNAQPLSTLWWMSTSTGQSRPGVRLTVKKANSSTQNPTLFAAVVTIWFKQNTLYRQ